MGVERIEAWRSSDGQVFKEHSQAAAYEAKCRLLPLLESALRAAATQAMLNLTKGDVEKVAEGVLNDMASKPGAYRSALEFFVTPAVTVFAAVDEARGA